MTVIETDTTKSIPLYQSHLGVRLALTKPSPSPLSPAVSSSVMDGGGGGGGGGGGDQVTKHSMPK